jgi:molybdate transport system substrate-binding protein
MIKLTIKVLLIGLVLMLVVGCSAGAASESDGGELLVFAASSLTESLQDTASEFEEDNPGLTVTLNFAGSQQLRTQLEQGAQADVFASANWPQMNAVADVGLLSGEAVSFATNRLVVIVPAESTEITSLEDLAQPGTKLVLAQAEVPVGAYSHNAIDNLADRLQYGTDYADRVLGNLVSEETNVRNVAQKVALGEADAGIVYQTDAMTPDIAERVRVIHIPDEFNVVASYPIAALSESAQPDLARQFVDFVLSDEGEQILGEYGFGPAGFGETS